MNAADDTPRQGRKIAQVIDGARAIFLRDGFEGASVDAIAREAGVSKATLYSYFDDKRMLFMEVGRIECARQAGMALDDIDADWPVGEVLAEMARRILAFMTSDMGQRVFRICVAESERFPELGRRFWESGPMVMRAQMIEWLDAAIARGELRPIEDRGFAADQFVELCKVEVFPRMVFGTGGPPTEGERERVIAGAVEMFLCRYGPRRGDGPAAPSTHFGVLRGGRFGLAWPRTRPNARDSPMLTPLLRRAAGPVLAVALSATAALGAQCGNDASGFERWKQEFSSEASRAGIGQRGLQALAGTSYQQRTINADRNQRSFRYSLNEFMRVRGSDTIVNQGRSRLQRNAAFFDALERAYGVPGGVILAIHGMETGFGRFMGDASVVSAIATLSYDCRRSQFFTEHLLAALRLVDRGTISPNTRGAMHGELGHTQFLPGNALRFGVDGNGDGRLDLTNQADALASTANFLRQKGWRPGAGYQPGQPNYRAIQAWNAASVYQQAIAIMAARIEGDA